MPLKTVPARDAGRSPDTRKAATRTPPSQKVCFPPRRGALKPWSSCAPLSGTRNTTVLSQSPADLIAAVTFPTP